MQLSHRITHLNGDGDDGWAVFYRARALKARGIAITDLTIGEHDIGTAADILDAMHRSARAGHTGYAAVPGTDALRDAIAMRTERITGVPTARANVIVTTGGQAALFAAHLAVADPGAAALFLDPYYATYPGTIRAAGLRPVPVACQAADGFQPRARDIAQRADGARALLINTPNNPTGAVYSRATLDGIAALCRERDLWLISDEVYDSQVWAGRHLSPRALPGMEERTLVVGSMSKAHAMTGSRIGWIVGPPDAIAALADLSLNTTYGVPGFIQDAATHALSKGDAAEAEVAAPFRRRRDLVLARVAGQDLVRAVPAQGAMYVMLDIRATGLDGEAFAHFLLDEARVAVMPGESFGRAAAGHVRLALTVDDQKLDAAVEQLLACARRHVTATAATR